MGEHVLDRAALGDVPGVHHDQAVGDVARARDVMCDVQERDALSPAEGGHQVQHADADRDVEHGYRLVGQDQLGPACERLRESDPLPLPPAQLVGIFAKKVARGHKADRFEQALRLVLTAPPAEVRPVQLQGPHDAVRDLIDGAQRPVGVLENHRHPAAVLQHLAPRAQALHRLAPVQDVAGRRFVDPGDQTRDRALAAATLADQGDDLVLVDREVDAVDAVQVATRKEPAKTEMLGEVDSAQELPCILAGPQRQIGDRHRSKRKQRTRSCSRV